MITLRRIGLCSPPPKSKENDPENPQEFDPVHPLARTQPELDIIHLLCGQVYFFGRDEVDIGFNGDGSVSRKHAKLEVVHPAGNVAIPFLKPHLKLEDLGSKHGTYINSGIDSGKQINPYEPTVLPVGSRVRFGKQWNVYVVEYSSLLVSTSFVDDKNLLTQTIRLLGGHRVNTSEESTHLVMDLMIMTGKLVLALMSLETVVSPQYFFHLLEFYQGSRDIKPVASEYLPPTDEPQLLGIETKCLVNPGRKALFVGKYFLFATSCLSEPIEQVIKLGQGRVGLLANKNLSIADILDDNTLVVVDLERMTEMDTVEKSVFDSYMVTGKRTRPIEVWQICLAVVHVNLDPWCNPYTPAPPRRRRTDPKVQPAKETPTSPLQASKINKIESESTMRFDVPTLIPVKQEAQDDDTKVETRFDKVLN